MARIEMECRRCGWKTPVPDIVRKARSMGIADTNAVGEYLERVQQLPD